MTNSRKFMLKPESGISQNVKRQLNLLNNVKMGGVIIVLKFFVTLWCKSTSL